MSHNKKKGKTAAMQQSKKASKVVKREERQRGRGEGVCTASGALSSRETGGEKGLMAVKKGLQR